MEFPGRYTPTVSVPLASQSPTTGTSPGDAQENCTSGAPPVFAFRRYHVAFDGRKTPIVSVPSASQSPATARSPGSP